MAKHRLRWAAFKGHLVVLAALDDHSPSVDATSAAEGKTPGHAAVTVLPETGASGDLSGKAGDKPLRRANSGGHAAVAGALVKNGATVDTVIHDGGRPLLQVEVRGNVPLMRFGPESMFCRGRGGQSRHRSLTGPRKRRPHFEAYLAPDSGGGRCREGFSGVGTPKYRGGLGAHSGAE